MTTFYGHPMGDLTFTHKEIEAIQAALKTMLDGVIPDLNPGICFNLERSVEKMGLSTKGIRYYRLVSLLSMDWEHHRNEGQSYTPYPVPHTDYVWEGEGLTYRISLMEHLLRRIQEAISPKTVSVVGGIGQLYTIPLSDLKEIHKEAKRILRRARAGEPNRPQGICVNLIRSPYLENRDEVRNFIIRMVGVIAMRWPHSTKPGKYTTVPVPLTETTWTEEGLEYRIDLLKYIIKRLKDTIRRAEKNGKATIK